MERDNPTVFDAQEKERQLRAESESWNTRRVESAQPGDIPLIDMAGIEVSRANFERVAKQIGDACRRTGFYTLTGHGIESMHQMFGQARRFHAQGPVKGKGGLTC